MLRKILSFTLSAALIILVAASTVNSEGLKENPYNDVSGSDWYYDSVTQLYWNSIIPKNEMFYPEYPDLRGNFVYFLYNLYLRSGGQALTEKECPFSDVDENMYYRAAVTWAAEKGIVSGVGEAEFAPEEPITKEQACVMIFKYADKFDIKLKKIYDDIQFTDSLNVSEYARTPVAVCKMAGFIYGDENGYFYPQNKVMRAESAALVYSLMCMAAEKPDEGDDVLSTKWGAYDDLYLNYLPVPMPFTARVDKGEAVDLSYFDDVALIGDSVTLSLQYYAASRGALGNAQFLCAGSLSPVNALWEVSAKSVHPSYRGKKMRVEEAAALCGAKKFYIMLGINSISLGIDQSVECMTQLIDGIIEKVPDAKIIVQSVTPMASTSNIISSKLNNTNVEIYNAKLEELCNTQGWYYLNVAEIFKDEKGYLKPQYCSDPNNMGIHFTNAADELWIEYLRTHVPEDLRN